MAAPKKDKRPMEVSPAGIVEYAWLNKPQPPHPKNPEGEAKYSVTLAMNVNDPKVKVWGAAVKALRPNSKNYPFHIDKETGNLLVKFSSVYKPRIVDAKRNDVPEGRYPSRGSTVKVAYVANEYDGFGGGVNLYLQGIQVIELVEFERKPLPFGDEEGYVQEAGGTEAPPADGRAPDGEPPPEPAQDDLPF
jgi:hypothetical protein